MVDKQAVDLSLNSDSERLSFYDSTVFTSRGLPGHTGTVARSHMK